MKRDELAQIWLYKQDKERLQAQQLRISVLLGHHVTQYELVALMNQLLLLCADDFIRQVYTAYINHRG